ncbi:MAG: hypothetical protein K2L47_00450, partial [Clostridia bacterium]|nr:hypothetical protein [Clostridia bacterium]
MREEEKNGTTEFEEFGELDLASYDDKVYMDSDSADNASTSMADSAVDIENATDDLAEESQNSTEESAVEMDADAYIAAEFEEMDKVLIIDGKKHKERKRRKRLSKQGKIILNSGIACVCLALFITVAVMFGPLLISIIFAETKTQGLGGADLIVDMTDSTFYFGTSGQVDLTKTFPGGTAFEVTEGSATLRGNNLSVAEAGEFVLSFTEADTNDTKVVDCMGVQDGVNVTEWAQFRSTAALGQIIILQDDIASPELEGLKRKDHGTITIENHVYGNGKIINVFEICCTRTKVGSKIYGAPYRQGNGKVWGDTGLQIRNNPNGEQIIFQDVHVTGNNMDTYDPDAPDISEEGETQATADENKPAGNMKGVTKETINNRGVLLFSKYGNLVDISSYADMDNNQVLVKHCLIENGGKVVHISDADVDIEGTIVRNAADTAISVATSANCASYIRSKNNVIANSLTGGILFYCFDGNISASNADATWNTLEIVEDSFLDIYNWKPQNGLAFLPETEGFADIANPIAASEIPKKDYDPLKGKDEDGNYYIHFAIIKIRTGNGLPMNGSTVIGYERLRYGNVAEGSNGAYKQFPIPGIATAIMKDIDVWGYYGVSDGDVTPTSVLGGETAEDLAKFYKELREGRTYS